MKHEEFCDKCGGTGRVTKATRIAASRKGGNALYLARGREYFSELGRKGGRPKALTLADIRQRGEAKESRPGGVALPESDPGTTGAD